MALVEGETQVAALAGLPLRVTTATPMLRDASGMADAGNAVAEEGKNRVNAVLVHSTSSPKEHALYIFGANGSLHAIFPIYDTSVMKSEGNGCAL
jgi:hypothetical protein